MPEVSKVKIFNSPDLPSLEDTVNDFIKDKVIIRVNFDLINQQHVAYIEYEM